MELCGEPLNHLEAAQELLDRRGEAYGQSGASEGDRVRPALSRARPLRVGCVDAGPDVLRYRLEEPAMPVSSATWLPSVRHGR